MLVYLDESGDLGWNFSAPYLRGGSSRFLTLAFLFVPEHKKHLPKRVIRRMYRKYGWPTATERKAGQLSHVQKLSFCQSTGSLVKNNPDIEICAITVKKQNVQPHIRTDSNKLYNYMIRVCAADRMARYDDVLFVPDERSIKVKSGNSLGDYLQTEIWFSCNARTRLICQPQASHRHLNLMFVDFLAHCVWARYEFQRPDYVYALKNHFTSHHLFF